MAIDPAREITSPAFNVDVKSVTIQDGNTDQDDGPPPARRSSPTAATTTRPSPRSPSAPRPRRPSAWSRTPAPPASTPPTRRRPSRSPPTGAPTAVDISTAQPATAVGSPVTFTVEVKDAAGNVTQLLPGESFDVTGYRRLHLRATPAWAAPTSTTGKTTVTGTPSDRRHQDGHRRGPRRRGPGHLGDRQPERAPSSRTRRSRPTSSASTPAPTPGRTASPPSAPPPRCESTRPR